MDPDPDSALAGLPGGRKGGASCGIASSEGGGRSPALLSSASGTKLSADVPATSHMTEVAALFSTIKTRSSERQEACVQRAPENRSKAGGGGRISPPSGDDQGGRKENPGRKIWVSSPHPSCEGRTQNQFRYFAPSHQFAKWSDCGYNQGHFPNSTVCDLVFLSRERLSAPLWSVFPCSLQVAEAFRLCWAFS